LAAALGLVVGAQGCAEDLRRSIKTDDGALDSGGPVVTEPVEGGEDGSPLVYRTQLDATAEAEWVPLDLDAELAGLVVALDREECGTGSNLTAIGQVADELKVPVVPIVTLTDLIGFLEARGRSADAELLREHKAKYGPK
jgi:orotate phosphoribosyltransferase